MQQSPKLRFCQKKPKLFNQRIEKDIEVDKFVRYLVFWNNRIHDKYKYSWAYNDHKTKKNLPFYTAKEFAVNNFTRGLYTRFGVYRSFDELKEEYSFLEFVIGVSDDELWGTQNCYLGRINLGNGPQNCHLVTRKYPVDTLAYLATIPIEETPYHLHELLDRA